MKRSISEIADTAHDDLESLREALSITRVMLLSIRQMLPVYDTAHQLAHVGVQHCDDWLNHAEGWISRMEAELYANDAAPQNCDLSIRAAHGLGETLALRTIWSREFAGLSQEALAKLISVKQATVSYIESGRTKRTSCLPDIARACKVDIAWLAFGSEVSQ